jgi:chaperonin cofactor prefoldin
MKDLKLEKKNLQDQANNVRIILKQAKAAESELRERIGKPFRPVIHSIERVLKKHKIEKPYYHGGKYNGKAMNRLMTNSDEIMEDIARVILELLENGRCNDAEVTLITEGYAVILHIFDAIFSYARLPSCTVTEELVADLRIFVQEGLRLWRGLDLSITPKVHAIEDHLCDQMLLFKGIGDLGEDFVEQSHQDGIKDHRRLKNPASHIISAEWQSKWEHVRKHPKVLRVQRQVQQHANRGQTIAIIRDERKRVLQETKRTIRDQSLITATTTAAQNGGVFIRSGRKRNIEEVRADIENAENLLMLQNNVN